MVTLLLFDSNDQEFVYHKSLQFFSVKCSTKINRKRPGLAHLKKFTTSINKFKILDHRYIEVVKHLDPLPFFTNPKSTVRNERFEGSQRSRFRKRLSNEKC